MREIGKVTAIEGNSIQISTELKSGCSGCVQRSTCGAGILSRAFPNRRGHFNITSSENFVVGQTLELELEQSALTRYALALYVIPLLALLAGAGLGSWLQPNHEGLAIGSGALAFGLSFFALKRVLKHQDSKAQRLVTVHHPVAKP